jgi:RNA polymerase sigma factor (sigma-70 family)
MPERPLLRKRRMRPVNAQSDPLAQLALMAIDGDASALSELCERITTPVFRICFRLLGEVREAEDASQDVLVKIITHLDSFQNRSQFMTWVYRIAIFHVSTLKSSRGKVMTVDETTFAALLEKGLAFGAQRTEQTSAVEFTAERKALAAEVCLSCTQGMLSILSQEERLALVLVELLGLDAPEAAAVCEVAPATLRQRLSRARLRLGAFLQKQCGVVNPAAACHCHKQIDAKLASDRNFHRCSISSTSVGNLPPTQETATAIDELRALRSLAVAFHPGGLLRAPDSLRERLKRVLPTVLRT